MMKKISNIFMIICVLAIIYFWGAIIFNYDLPEFLHHKKTPKEQQEYFDNFQLHISVKEFKKICDERDSLLKITKQNK